VTDRPREIPADALFDALFASTPLGLALVDAELRFVRVNDRLAEIDGVPAEAHLGRTLAELLPALAPELEPLYHRVLETGEAIVDVELAGDTPADPGRVRHWLASYVPVTDGGMRVGVLAMVEETTRLRRAEQEVGRILERIGDAFVAFDRDLRYTYVNAKAGELFGREPESLLGRLYLEEYPEAEGSSFHRAYVRALEEQRPVVLEEHYAPWDRWFENRVYPSADGLAVFFTEITDRRRAEKALREATELLDALHRSAPVAIATIAPDGALTSWSAGGERLLGWREEELLGKGPVIVPEDLLDEARALYARAAAGETIVGFETQRLHRDGSRVDVSLSAAPLRDAGGAVTGIVGVLTDLSERRQAEETLRESEARMRLALETAGMGIWEMDLAEERAFSDARTAEIFGHHPPASAAEFFELLHPDDRERVAAEIEAATEEGAPYSTEFRVRTPFGETRWVHAAGTVIRDEHGEPARMIGVALDVTEQKRAEEELRALTAELEARVAARTRELDSARAEAERANAAKSEFLSRMSHELRTPLNAILGFAQLLERDGLAREQRESVEQILTAGRHLLELVEELLDVARIESGVLELEAQPLLLAEVVERALELVQPLADAGQIALGRCPHEARELRVLADRQRLLQVVLNLLSNAVKFNRVGGRVDVTCARGGEERVVLSVHDTGVGLSEADALRVFLPFERVHSPVQVEGTGLGLSVAKALVEAMGGTIGVESTPGEGSRFYVELPLAPEGAPAAEAPPGAERTVLLVEDNLANVRLVERTLAGLPGTRVLVATSGVEGIALARAERPDLVLLDLGLPDLSGHEVLRRLRSEEATAQVPVVVVSADARRETIEQLLSAGALDYLPKPIDVERLLELAGRF
jgi:PAS domain S-box-containing protein